MHRMFLVEFFVFDYKVVIALLGILLDILQLKNSNRADNILK